MPGTALARPFYARPSTVVAPELLNKVLVVGGRAARIVEVEAYAGEDDPASHAYRGRTARNATMFGPPGGLYVYFTYGMHWCANAVCSPDGSSSAVLLRAAAPVAGLDAMYAARPAARRDTDLCSGPAKLCQALGIDGGLDGRDLVAGGGLVDGSGGGDDQRVTILDDGTPPPRRPGRSPRIGIRVAVEVPWRWFVAGDPNVSRPR